MPFYFRTLRYAKLDRWRFAAGLSRCDRCRQKSFDADAGICRVCDVLVDEASKVVHDFQKATTSHPGRGAANNDGKH